MANKQLFLNNFDWNFIGSVKDAPVSGTPATELGYGILQISTAAEALLINPTGNDWYVLTAYKRAGSIESNYEILRVLGVNEAGYAVPGECRIRVLRGQEGTTPQAYVSGDYISLRATAGGLANMLQPEDLVAPLAGKVDKVAGKGLSTEDYTTAEKAKLANIPEGGVAAVTSVAGRTGAVVLTKGDVGLSNVDNTPDADKPVSAPQAVALSGKENVIAAGTTAQYWRGDKTWRDFATDVRAAVLTGLSTATNAAVVAADTVLAALGKLQAQINAHFGAGGTAHPNATTSVAGFMSSADKTKLDGVAAGATANSTDAFLLDRGNHTGAQAIATVTGLQTALDGKEGVIAAGTTAQYWRGNKTWADFATDVRVAVLTGLSLASNAAVAATDSVLVALGKLQVQVSERAPIASPSFTGTATFQGLRETALTASTGSAYTVANTSASVLILTLTANCTFTFPAASSVGQFTLLLTQDATGSRTVTWPSSVRWPGGTAPTLTSAASRTDVISFISDGTFWLGFVGGLNYTRA